MWLLSDDKTFKAIGELEKAADRTLGILAVTIVDSQLTTLLHHALYRDDSAYSKKVRAEMFKPDAPLGTLGAKIGISYLIGIFSPDGHADLQNLKNIRNAFAHYSEFDTFNSQKIRDLCSNFKLVDQKVGGPMRYIPQGDESQAFEIDAFVLDGGAVHMASLNEAELKGTPRGRFTATAQLFCAALSHALRPRAENDPTPSISYPLL